MIIMYRFFLAFFFLLHCLTNNAIAQSDHIDNAISMFNKVENELIFFRKKTKKEYYEPVEDFERRFYLIKRHAPLLLSETDKYKEDLLCLLSNKKVLKDKETNRDVIFILYNLCLDNYITACERIYSLFKLGVINLGDLSFALDPDFVNNIKVAKNYENHTLRVLYCRIIKDLNKSKKKDELELALRLGQVLSGETWEDYRVASKIQPPIIQGCKH